MLYTAYEMNRRMGAPVVAASEWTARALQGLPTPLGRTPAVRHMVAACDILANARPTHRRPAFGITTVPVGDREADVFERPALKTPFGTLLHFAKPSVTGQPRVLVVGPMSGHFTTLIRPTIKTLLSDHDVYVIDWHNARDIPASHGPFGLDEYIDHVMQALRHLGPDTHMLAVCQPAPLVLAAVALLAEANDPAEPASVTTVASPPHLLRLLAPHPRHPPRPARPVRAGRVHPPLHAGAPPPRPHPPHAALLPARPPGPRRRPPAGGGKRPRRARQRHP